ncbi:alpha/beta fold hydrolase [Aureitalea marina]|uniref:AB hydrolase-1 domain-containing protein n=1 Tax=Aureitalea marina TaxID=930804 RepID=A0A2S7KR58_9FLAO|nr:alpha/beta fold hydrolase [Aureitalea marina]PQB05043.1 hypothetical protein BST85_09165 [Aureitalea marina]
MKLQPLLLLHGALGSKAQLAGIKKELDPHYEVHSMDFEGHGDKPSDRDFRMEHFTENVVSFLDEHNLGSVSIFGYSMGGYVALNLARQDPDRVKRIVTYGTKFDWRPETAAKEVKMLDPDLIQAKVPHFAAHLDTVHQGTNWKDVLSKTAKMMLALGENPPLTPSTLSKIDQPVLIGIGSEDNMVSLGESENTAATLKNGELKVLDRYKHPIEKNDPAILTNMISSFILESDENG